MKLQKVAVEVCLFSSKVLCLSPFKLTEYLYENIREIKHVEV